MRTALLLAATACASPPATRPARSRLEPLLLEAIRFPTVAGNEQARLDQQQWLLRTAQSLGLTARDAGPVTEVELPGPPGAPVLGLVVHGDVQPVDEKGWTVPPFAGVERSGVVYGRGAADDKGPLVQALLAMHAVRDLPRTHTVLLLVGSDEESGSTDMKTYLASHRPPAYSLVLDSAFPVVVGEKAWDGLAVLPADPDPGTGKAWTIEEIDAGLAPSIVPDPGWDGWTVNVATLKKEPRLGGKLALVINLRRPPPLTGPQSRERLYAEVRKFSPRLLPGEVYFSDEPLVFDRNAKIVRRLMDAYGRATGARPPPAISGGGTYAKRSPHAIAFGRWVPGQPPPRHAPRPTTPGTPTRPRRSASPSGPAAHTRPPSMRCSMPATGSSCSSLTTATT